MKRYKKRKNKSLLKILTFIIIIFASIKIFNNNFKFNPFNNININKEFNVIKLDYNKNYLGVGQKTIKNEDGFFTTFTTFSTDKTNEKTYTEYKQNGSSSWSQKQYWGGTMEKNGCGITALAILLSAYGYNLTPDNLREKYYPVLNYENLSNELKNSYKIDNTDFYYDSIHLSDKSIIEHLKSDRPILICVWNKPKENRWTSLSHYMVLLATDNNNMVYVSNPNGLKDDINSSGWYNINEITPYLAKALYIED